MNPYKTGASNGNDIDTPDAHVATKGTPAGNGGARAREHLLTVEYPGRYEELREANQRQDLAALVASDDNAQARRAPQRQRTLPASASDALRQPLEPIRRAAALLEHAHSDRMLLSRLQGIIERQTERRSMLIDAMDGGTGTSARNPGNGRGTVDLVDILCLAVARSKSQLAARRQVLTRQPLPDALRVHGDAARLGQAFSCLLDNASTLTPPGGAIMLSAKVLADTVTISVSHESAGLEPDALSGIFGLPSHDTVAMARDNGFIHGLAGVRDLVEAYGGTIVARSAGKNQGSVFVVTLPKA